MKNKIAVIIKCLFVLLLLKLSPLANAQGCSDAGVCTINSFKPSTNDSSEIRKNNAIKLGISNGKADHSISIISSYFEYNRGIGKKLSIDLKLTYISQNGNGISSSDLSDIYLNANYPITKTINTTAGIKIPLNKANKSRNGLPMPMDYQSSLGTTDLILGLSYQLKKLKFVVALQQPLQQNNNQFLSDSLSINSAFSTFQSTNKFVRSGDVLFRMSYPITLFKKLTISPSILPIYHLKDDKFTDITGKQKDIIGSQGLTLNGNIYFDYQINKSNVIDINVGMPFITRKSRPDGLTRSYVLTFEYKILF